MKNVIIAILVALLIVAGFMIGAQNKSNVAYEPWPETEPATATTPKPQTDPIACTPSISVSSPAQGAAYTTGQQVTIKWTSCGVQNINIGLMSGGKDHGQITQTSIPASQGSYQWAATNPGKSFTGLNTNSYQIGIESGSLVVKSGTFTVTTPANTQGNVQLDMSNSYAQTYRTLFTDEFSKQANLDGHFRLVAVGCGSGCMNLYALDKNTGKTYKLGASNFSEYSILDNQVRATLQDGQMMIYLFNPQQDKFEATAV